jgi:uncharacterized membrane protein (DUF485 family)
MSTENEIKGRFRISRRKLSLIIAVSVIALAVALYFALPLLMPFQPTYNAAPTKLDIIVHTWVRQFRDGILISETYHPMSLTNAGKDWIADKLFNSGGTNVTQYAMYIACSADSSSFSASWTAIPAEITANGLNRALAAWADTGTGTGNLTNTFTATGTQSSQLYGLYSNTYALAPASTLVAAEQQGAGAVKNLILSDTLAITVQITAT